jgi:AcrR family transcriptional regulator
MPKGFTEIEKERIRTSLREEGQKLFVSRGIKKVTIDDLTKTAHIAKGSFYLFYQTKEELFLEITSYYQQKIFDDLEPILSAANGSSKDKVLLFLKAALNKFNDYPLLGIIDAEVMELLYRKLPPEKVDAELRSDISRLEIFKKHQISFNYPLPIVVKILQKTIAACRYNQADIDNAVLTDILLESIVEKVVNEHV